MARTDEAGVMRFIRGVVTPGEGVPDAELVRRFASAGDEQAFRTLASRYGPVVWSVCRRLSRNHHDAEDAFQATLLVFARKAGELRTGAAVGGWLYAVAHRVAARVRSARRGGPADTEPADPRRGPLDALTAREAEGALHEELLGLPEKYRAPLVLCCLEGLSRDEAAGRLGWSTTRVKNLLERGRELLRTRLGRRGVALGLPLLTNLLATPASAAPPPVVESAVRYATGTAPPAAISSLVTGVGQVMWISKWKWAVAGCAALALAAGGTLAGGLRAVPPESPAVPVAKAGFAPVPAVPAKPAAEPKKEAPKPAWDVAAEYLQLVIDGGGDKALKLTDQLTERHVKELQVAGLSRVKFAMILINDTRVMAVTERAKLRRRPDADATDNHVTVTLERKGAAWLVWASDVADENAVVREIDQYLDGKFDLAAAPGVPGGNPPAEAKDPKPVWDLAAEFVALALAEKDDDALSLAAPGFGRDHKVGAIREAGVTGAKFGVVLINDNRVEVFTTKQDLILTATVGEDAAAHLAVTLKKQPAGGAWQVLGTDFHSRSPGRLRDDETVKPRIERYLRGMYDGPAKQ